jgi:flagellar hook-basal body complex protein FliE
MRVEPLFSQAPLPDVAPPAGGQGPDDAAFSRALDALANLLGDADGAEDAFAYGKGTLQEAVYERARADVALSAATAAAQRAAQSVQTILNMQV